MSPSYARHGEGEDCGVALVALPPEVAAYRQELRDRPPWRDVSLNCPQCGIRLTSRIAYDDHLYNKHGVLSSGEGGGPLQGT